VNAAFEYDQRAGDETVAPLWQRRDHDGCETTRERCTAPLLNRPGAALSTGKCAHFNLELTAEKKGVRRSQREPLDKIYSVIA